MPSVNHPPSLQASVSHLLSRAYTLPCSAAAQAFSQLVQPTARFQVALDALLPLLDPPAQLYQRILVAYILYSLYAPYPMVINPFNSVLHKAFVSERDQALKIAGAGGPVENLQLVWVLWKILKGDGSDIGFRSPNDLARSPLPPEFKLSELFLDGEAYKVDKHNKSISENLEPLNLDARRSPRTTLCPTPATPSESIGLSSSGKVCAASRKDQENERIAHAMILLLAARERVLTLAEQRSLAPSISQLASTTMVTSLDLALIVSHNPSIAYTLFLALFSVSCSFSNLQLTSRYIEVLKRLPPTLASFDLMGRLLHDPTTVLDNATGGQTTVADLVRTEVLGWFIHESIEWLDAAEKQERDGLVGDDRFAKGVQNLCRFYHSLIKHDIVQPSSDADSAEMAHFTLRNSRFEEANTLYRALLASRF